MPHTIAVLSQKGGTGKTTTVRTLTDALRRAPVRTLAIDLAPRAVAPAGDRPGPPGQPVGLLGRAARGAADDYRGALGQEHAGRGDPRRRGPRQPHAGGGRADAGRQDGPRADAAPRAHEGHGRLRGDPD